MKRVSWTAVSLVLIFFLGTADVDAATTRRFALSVGANRGAADRASLRYAVADAERFARVIARMGGVNEADLMVLREPARQVFLDALQTTRARAAQARLSDMRIELIVYFSGHADDKGLMLGRESLAYRDLRAAIQGIGADVGIAILDACASGAITRIKGGQTHPAFLSDASTQVQGYAFLTSSSENEAAQESDRLQGSYFTHALLSGLRGAADVTSDGKVTLGEAYQFAFSETLAATTPTQAGAQHPSWDIKMAGTGDVVLTDMRQTASSLTLGMELDGRFFIHNPKQQLVAELYKPAGRAVELGLEPGEYDVHFEQAPALMRTRIALADGQRLILDRAAFKPARRIPTRRRGLPEPGASTHDALYGLSRVEMRLGAAGARVRINESTEDVDINGAEFGLLFTHWVRSGIALNVEMGGSNMAVRTNRTAEGQEEHTQGLFHILCGARYYPPLAGSIRPYLSTALGPMTEMEVKTFTPTSGKTTEETNVGEQGTRLGAHAGGGVDLIVSRYVHLGVYMGTIMRSGYKSRLGLGFSIGGAWGRKRAGY